MEAVAALAALAHESRLAVFRHLVRTGPEGDTPGRIAARLGMPASTLSFHLKELSAARLVSARASSRNLIYSADFARMAALMTYLTDNCCRGMPGECLAPMETALARCAPSCAPAKEGDAP
jgi:DNA-binding transcriptional ArsR family regulator